MQQDPAGGRAPLARVGEAGGHGRLERGVDVGILHHDERVLAAELELRTRQIRRGLGLDLLANLGRSGERDRAHARDPGRCALPIAEPGPVTQLKTPAGRPARSNRPAMNTPDQGVNDAGLNTTVLPVSSAGSVLRHITFIGKFHGLMTPTTPSGWYCTHVVMSPERAGPGVAVEGRHLVQVVGALHQRRIHFGARFANGLAVLQA